MRQNIKVRAKGGTWMFSGGRREPGWCRDKMHPSKANPSDLLAPPRPSLEILSHDELIMKLTQS